MRGPTMGEVTPGWSLQPEQRELARGDAELAGDRLHLLGGGDRARGHAGPELAGGARRVSPAGMSVLDG